MLDNYFSTGNVYIIDDKINEASPIINSLYKNQIPHIYLDGSLSNLPKYPKQVRLLFLDLNLKPSLNPKDKKSFKNIHAGILNRLLANNASSYLILVWSKQEDTFLEDFEEIFVDSNNDFNLNQRPPLEIISLEKKDFFESHDNKGEIVYVWKKDKEADLLKLIEEKLLQNEAFKILAAWEDLISKSGSRTVDYLFDLVQGETHAIMNSKLNSIITSLSVSYLGFDNFLNLDNQKKTDAFMLALSELIDDEIDNEILNNSQPEFESWLPKKRLDSLDKGKLNSKLLTSVETSNKYLTGSILKGSPNHDYVSMLANCIDESRSMTKKIIQKAKDEKKAELTRDEKRELKISVATQISNNPNKFIPIELNITPLCDVVQNKQEYYRLIPGFLIDKKSSEHLFTNTDRNYFSPLLYSAVNLKECILILDFRFLHAVPEGQIGKMRKLCALRKSFVDEIQSKLANHVSRLGILYLP